MSNVLFREWLNGALIPLNLFIMAVIFHTLMRQRVEFGRGWSKTPGVASACALLWIFCADFIRSVLAWTILHAQSQGIQLPHSNAAPTLFYVVAAVMATAATFRLIYISWGHRGWISAGVFTVAFVLLIEFVPATEIQVFGLKMLVP